MRKRAYFYGIAPLTPNSKITVLEGLEYSESIDCHKIRDEFGRLYVGSQTPEVEKVKERVSGREIINETYTVELPLEINSRLRQTKFMVRKSG